MVFSSSFFSISYFHYTTNEFYPFLLKNTFYFDIILTVLYMRFPSAFIHTALFICLFLLLFDALPASASTSDSDSIPSSGSMHYLVESRATVSDGSHTPFWLMSNMSGLGSVKTDYGYVRGALFKEAETSRKFSWEAGVDLAGTWRNQSRFYIHQLYAQVNHRSISAMLGSKEIPGEFNNPRLSSGNILYSGNALPIPQLRVGIFDFTPVWKTNGWLQVKGYIAYGAFTDSRWEKSWCAPETKRCEGVLYHSKGMWFRGGKTDIFPLQGEIGIEMATQFGGKVFMDGKVIDMYYGWKDWIKAFFPVYKTRDAFTGSESSIVGNMLGAYTIALSWLPESDWGIKTYFEHYFEDQSQMTFEYGWKDGFWGIEVDLPDNPYVSAFVAEYLYTKDQTGAVLNNSTPGVPEQVSGRDNYFNHSTYTGWQNWGLGIGNPLIISPLFNSDHVLRFRSNRVQAWHTGLEGHPTQEINWRVLLSYSKNWGTYSYPFKDVENNFNSLFELNWKPKKLHGWYGSASIAFDSGELLGRSLGAMITVGKTGNLSLNKKKKL